MEGEKEGGRGQWWWGGASGVQLGMGMYWYRKEYAGECRLMPLKAFAVASLFVGSIATAAVAIISANGIHSVEDMKEVGANIRTGLGVRPRASDE